MPLTWLLVGVAATLVGCVETEVYRCGAERSCGEGTCESTGLCSFPDVSCPDGRRYGSLSGALADQCVSADLPDGGGGDGAVDAGASDGASPDGPGPDAGACDLGTPCLSGVMSQGRCVYTPVSGACEDGLACTRGDICSGGVCLAGAWDNGFGACSSASVPIYRSVGPSMSTPLASGGGNPLRIRGETATFAVALPVQVGVGDVIQYDANDDGVVDSLAFIHGRTSSTVFTVRDTEGGYPRPTQQDDGDWLLMRSYISLAAALAMTENTSIAAGLRDFESCGPSCDLVSRHRSFHIAAYADAVDLARVFVTSWRADARNWLTIFTPTRPDQVGVSQRHDGTWGTGYRRTQGIDIQVPFVRLDGLSLRVDELDRVYLIGLDQGRSGEVEIAHSYAEMAHPTTWFRVYDVFGTNPVLVRVSNSIGISRSTASDSYVFYNNQGTSQAYFYNCTGMAVGGVVFQKDQGPMEVVNGLGVITGTGVAYRGLQTATDVVTYSVSSDASLGAWPTGNNRASQTIRFVNLAGGDLHLSASDTAAHDRGSNLTGSAAITIVDDVDGQPRPALPTTWDIGADELP